VSVSLNANRIASHAGLRASAGQTLVLLITPLIIAATLLTPDQPDWLLGAELIAIGLAAGAIFLASHRVKVKLPDEDQRLISLFSHPGPNMLVMLLVIASGATVAAGQSAGLYLLFPASIVFVVSGLLNAWYFLLPPPRQQPDTQ
jgi:hypothetical protein